MLTSVKRQFIFLGKILIILGFVVQLSFALPITGKSHPTNPLDGFESHHQDPDHNHENLPSGGFILPKWLRPQKPATTPDLNVKFIERTPEYDYDANQKWPEPNETVTFTAHVANRGDVNTGVFTYQWLIDGVVQDSGTHASLTAGSSDEISFEWDWQLGEHTVEIILDVNNTIAEVSESNNSVVDRTNALSLGIWVEESFYEFFNDSIYQAGWGGNSYDDWVQRHANIWNEMFADAEIYNRVRVAKIVVVPDGDLNCETNRPAVDKGVDLMWGFPSEQVGVPSPANCTWWTPRFRDDQSTWDRDMALIHELNHARYHIDIYGFNMFIHARPLLQSLNETDTTLQLDNPPDFVEFQPPLYFVIGGEMIYCTQRAGDTYSNCTRGADGTIPRTHDSGDVVYAATIRLLDGEGNAVLGSELLPVSNPQGELIYFGPDFGIDIMNTSVEYGPYSTAVLNRIAGQRARCGNANAPCNIGEFLDEVSPNNYIEVQWSNGVPVPDAKIDLYQATPFPGVWYAREFDSIPDISVTTDETGRADLGASPFSATGDITHTYGYSNVIALVRITTEAGVEIHLIDLARFNMAYWQGDLEPVFEIQLESNLSPPGAQNNDIYLPLMINPASGLFYGAERPYSTNTLIVAEETPHQVTKLDLSNNPPASQSQTVGQAPVSLTADADFIYVVNQQSDTVTVVNKNNLTVVDTISVGDEPIDMSLSRDGAFGYVANHGSSSVSVIDLQTRNVVTTISIIGNPTAVATSPTEDRVYVLSSEHGKMTIINSTNNSVIDWVHLGDTPVAMEISPNGRDGYILDKGLNLMMTVDLVTLDIIDVLAVPGNPDRIVMTDDGAFAYVATESLESILLIDLSTKRTVRGISVGTVQSDLALSDDEQYLFVALPQTNDVAIIETASGDIVEQIGTQGDPTAVLLLDN